MAKKVRTRASPVQKRKEATNPIEQRKEDLSFTKQKEEKHEMAKKALVVGINRYGPPNDLPSCVHDAEAFADLLESVYKFDQIRRLSDEEATKERIDKELSDLFKDAGQDDRLVFFYSGHGYQHATAAGTIEEALVCQDARFYDSSELSAKMQELQLPAGVLTIVLDSCFSGGVEKVYVSPAGNIEVAKNKRWQPPDLGEARHDSEAIQAAKQYIPMGYTKAAVPQVLASHLTRPQQMAKAFTTAVTSLQVTPLTDPNAKGLLLSACLSNETAAASTSHTNGLSAFTYCLLDSFKRLGLNHSSTDLVQVAGDELKQLGFPQTPMVKEPITPPHLGSQAFLSLQSLGAPVTEGQDPLRDAINEAVLLVLNQRKDKSMQPMSATGQKGWFDDVTSIVSQVVPIVIGALQSKGFQPGLSGMSQPSLGGQKGWFDDVTSIVSHVVPIVIGALQSKGFQPRPEWYESAVTRGSEGLVR